MYEKNTARTKSHNKQPKKFFDRFVQPISKHSNHPALLPGIGVEKTYKRYKLKLPVFVSAAIGVLVVVLWGALAPENLGTVSDYLLGFITYEAGWFFNVLSLAIFVFMLWLGLGRHRDIKLGADDEKPEFSTFSWVAMLFSAGVGVLLIFYGPAEPLAYFLDLPPVYAELPENSHQAIQASINQAVFHWGPIAFSYYALVGGAIAYAAYRKGRVPLMSSLLEPLFGKKTAGPLGAVVDVLTILVTLFSVSISLGIGALQIGTGFQIVAGVGPLGNAALIGIIAVLCLVFILSALSGIKRGIRLLSNFNMTLAALLGIFILVAGPTTLVLNLIPGTAMSLLGDLPKLLAQSVSSGENAEEFMASWTTFYWAWWVSWAPFVGLFVAKISRGRTLRQFVLTVVFVPCLVCVAWFAVVGGTTLFLEKDGVAISESETTEAMFFQLLEQFPLATVTSLLTMLSIIIFFVTTADSASVVMSSIAEGGSPKPKLWNTAVWGLGMGAVAAVLLTATGEAGLSRLQSTMMITAAPFAVVLILTMVAWAKELNRDPSAIRRRFEKEALRRGVEDGIAEHGDDFNIAVKQAPEGEGAGAWLDTKDPLLTEWWEDATGPIDIVEPGTPEETDPDQDKNFRQ